MALQTVLAEQAVYVAGDRFVCASTRCAGVTAVTTGRDIDGHKLRKVNAQDVAEWATYDLGALRCECGSVTAQEGGA